jgi:pimeloyl-ACP methyl ester carboxylesterase
VTVDLHVREAGHGQPVVLLHAFPLSSAMWLDQREGLSRSCRLITPDLRGFGGSDLGDEPPALDAMADDVAALLDRLELDRVVLGGLSMGGYVSMAFVRRHADRVAALVLADTKASADGDAARENRERIAQQVQDPDSTVLVDEVLPTLVGPTTVGRRPLVHGRVRALVQAAPPAAVAWAERAMAARPDSIDTLAGIQVPALIVVGIEDRLATTIDAKAMAEVLPDATVVEIPQSGHLSAIEAPDAFNDALRGFLDGTAKLAAAPGSA